MDPQITQAKNLENEAHAKAKQQRYEAKQQKRQAREQQRENNISKNLGNEKRIPPGMLAFNEEENAKIPESSKTTTSDKQSPIMLFFGYLAFFMATIKMLLEKSLIHSYIVEILYFVCDIRQKNPHRYIPPICRHGMFGSCHYQTYRDAKVTNERCNTCNKFMAFLVTEGKPEYAEFWGKHTVDPAALIYSIPDEYGSRTLHGSFAVTGHVQQVDTKGNSSFQSAIIPYVYDHAPTKLAPIPCSSSIPCRYAKNCNRADCKFWHPAKESQVANVSTTSTISTASVPPNVSTTSAEPKKSRCKYGKNCNKGDKCEYSHDNVPVDTSSIPCNRGATCEYFASNCCKYKHDTPAPQPPSKSQTILTFMPVIHVDDSFSPPPPPQKPCRYGAGCRKINNGCPFAH